MLEHFTHSFTDFTFPHSSILQKTSSTATCSRFHWLLVNFICSEHIVLPAQPNRFSCLAIMLCKVVCFTVKHCKISSFSVCCPTHPHRIMRKSGSHFIPQFCRISGNTVVLIFIYQFLDTTSTGLNLYILFSLIIKVFISQVTYIMPSISP